MIKLNDSQELELLNNRSLVMAIGTLLNQELSTLEHALATAPIDAQELIKHRAQLEGARILVSRFTECVKTLGRKR